MRLAVTGREGQVVRALLERGALQGHEIMPLGRPVLDLTAPETILPALKAAAPEAIISAAAYTAVDLAESESEIALAVNSKGVGRLADAARQMGIPIIHLSTDYVFDGCKGQPYVETDPTGPATAYGRSKLAGEQAVLAAQADAAILRTAWVYSPFGKNFVKTMLALAQGRDEVRVVADQVGNPTSALDIADATLVVAANLISSPNPGLRGLFHMAGDGATSWAEFAEEIFALSVQRGGPVARVVPIPSTDYPTPAPRPANSRLDCTRLQAAHGILLPPWRESLSVVVSRVLRDMGQN